jgi:hypothetical protein
MCRCRTTASACISLTDQYGGTINQVVHMLPINLILRDATARGKISVGCPGRPSRVDTNRVLDGVLI